jgi:predicted nucleotidyltransferase
MQIQVEKLPQPLRRKGLDKALEEICIRNDVVFLAVFGSFVRGEQRRGSDVDIAVEFDSSKNKTLLDLVGLEEELSGAFKRKVDLGVFRSLSPYIIDEVKQEMCVIYDKR